MASIKGFILSIAIPLDGPIELERMIIHHSGDEQEPTALIRVDVIWIDLKKEEISCEANEDC